MHVNKIVPFSVVILLITVSFAGIALLLLHRKSER
jgi:hypothetical protein